MSHFQEALPSELQSKFGHKIRVFDPHKDIQFGQNPQECISQALNEAMVLIPVLTPSFFNDQNCRDILTRFLERERKLGRNDLVLAVYYQHVPALDNAQQANDTLIHAIAQRRMLNWQPLRGKDFNDPQVRQELEQLAQRIKEISDGHEQQKAVHEQQKEIREVPFVVAAMNQKETQELMLKAKDQDNAPVENDRLQNFIQAMRKYKLDVQSFRSRYHDNRDDWTPYVPQDSSVSHSSSNRSISGIIHDIVERFNESSSNRIQIQPVSFSEDFFSDHDDARRSSYKQLRNAKNGILIIDPLSLFHPKIAQNLKDSSLLLDCSLLLLSPVSTEEVGVNSLVEEEFLSFEFLLPDRHEDIFDVRYGVGIADRRIFTRHFYALLDDLARQGQSPHPESKYKMTQELGDPRGGYPW